VSRIAEVLRKSSGVKDVEETFGSHAERHDRDSWAAMRIPWELDSAAATERSATGTATGVNVMSTRDPVPRNSLPVANDDLTLLLRLFQPRADGPRVRSVVVCAIGDERGSAAVCVALAQALASQKTGSVCLVDANLRSPAIHTLVGSRATHGLSEALIDRITATDFVTSVADGLWLLPAGSLGSAALPYLTAKHVQPELTRLLGTFDQLIVHAPAANVHRDASLLAPLADGVVLVIEANATRREAARRAAAQLQSMNATVLGAILTNRTFPIPNAIYRIL
jgi:Mrp family chromosome partitioning ATPase